MKTSDFNCMVEANIKVNMKSKENAGIFLKSFTPEIKSIPMKRSSLEFLSNENIIEFRIEASDINAMRASMNSILNFVNVVNESLNFIENSSKIE
jgi:tRNA threonylcarbamoyladenosine modification (KEOPS) complex  Pcc1 subunit